MITVLLATLLTAGAAETELEVYPLVAPLTLPSEGAVRFAVPIGLRTPADPSDGTDLLLVDADGRSVPVAWVRGERPPAVVRPSQEGFLTRPHRDGGVRVEVRERPLDGLRVKLGPGPILAEVVIETPGGERVSGPHQVWRHGAYASTDIPFPAELGEWTVRATEDGAESWLDIVGLRYDRPHAPELRVPVAVDPPRLLEDGGSTWDLVLTHAVPVRGVALQVQESIFARPARLSAAPEDPWPRSAQWVDHFAGEEISRIRYGGTALEQTEVPLSGAPSDMLQLWVAGEGQAPLTVIGAELLVEGVHGLVLDAGPGPHLLYGGAAPSTSSVWDLKVARRELARSARVAIEAGAVDVNPLWTSPEERAGLSGAGPVVVLRGWGWTRPVEGAPGLVRVALPADVLAEAREDLADLRLVDAEGRQVPYVLRRRGGDQRWTELAFSREEADGRSLLEVVLPEAGVPVGSVTLTTDASVFSRQVSVGRPGAGGLEAVRAVVWEGADRPGSLTLDVDRRFGDRLRIAIDNGDDPPLPITGVEVRWPSWELLAVLPDGPVALVYGAPRAKRPSYDLDLLRPELSARVRQAATLGPPEAYAGPPMSSLDRGAVMAGLVFAGLGLGGLSLSLLRAAPE